MEEGKEEGNDESESSECVLLLCENGTWCNNTCYRSLIMEKEIWGWWDSKVDRACWKESWVANLTTIIAWLS